MTLPESSVLLITGVMAAGKSTVAQAAAERLPKSVHLRGDLFRRMIINGRAAMEPDMSEQAYAQLRLRYQIAATVADRYCQAGFVVVYQDVIVGPMLNDVIALHQRWPLHVVVLCPDPAVVAQRDAARNKVAYRGWEPDGFDKMMRETTPRVGLWLDNSTLTVDETVDAIFAQWAQTREGLPT
ncbi:MAG: AAA family ATPase [Anaerolineae bacterium]|nr:AAA family ATPase [Anaerolineae bacterium]